MAQSHSAPTELGSEGIGKLLKKYAVPGIIAMTASSLYNMVDSMFIGHIPGVGSLALSGLAVCFPLMNLGPNRKILQYVDDQLICSPDEKNAQQHAIQVSASAW